MTMEEIILCGRTYVRKPKQVIEALFKGPTTPHGLFRPVPGPEGAKAAVLYQLDGTPRLLICASTRSRIGFAVTAHEVEGGKVRYMFGLSSPDARWAGLEGLGYRDTIMEIDAAFSRQEGS